MGFPRLQGGRSGTAVGVCKWDATGVQEGMQQEGSERCKEAARGLIQQVAKGMQGGCNGDTTGIQQGSKGAAMRLQHGYKGDTTGVQEECKAAV